MTRSGAKSYLEPTREAGRAFFGQGIAGPVVMLNLLRFRAVADYSATPALAPEAPISGAAAYGLYVEHTTPFSRRRAARCSSSARGAAS